MKCERAPISARTCIVPSRPRGRLLTKWESEASFSRECKGKSILYTKAEPKDDICWRSQRRDAPRLFSRPTVIENSARKRLKAILANSDSKVSKLSNKQTECEI
eukprot:4007676-Pleurochrysis_carterae.AAC.2